MIIFNIKKKEVLVGSKRAGFTLLELVIVIIIIGVLTSLALPRLFSVIKRAKYVEAMNICRFIVSAQAAYYMLNNEFTTDIADLNMELPPSFVVKGGRYYAQYKNAERTYILAGLGFEINPGATQSGAGLDYHKLGVDMGVDSKGNPGVSAFWWREDKTSLGSDWIGGGQLHLGGGFNCCEGCSGGGCTYRENGWPGLK